VLSGLTPVDAICTCRPPHCPLLQMHFYVPMMASPASGNSRNAFLCTVMASPASGNSFPGADVLPLVEIFISKSDS
jgi:hypothetical protein